VPKTFDEERILRTNDEKQLEKKLYMKMGNIRNMNQNELSLNQI
jgi:hypothetical protein